MYFYIIKLLCLYFGSYVSRWDGATGAPLLVSGDFILLSNLHSLPYWPCLNWAFIPVYLWGVLYCMSSCKWRGWSNSLFSWFWASLSAWSLMLRFSRSFSLIGSTSWGRDADPATSDFIGEFLLAPLLGVIRALWLFGLLGEPRWLFWGVGNIAYRLSDSENIAFSSGSSALSFNKLEFDLSLLWLCLRASEPLIDFDSLAL